MKQNNNLNGKMIMMSDIFKIMIKNKSLISGRTKAYSHTVCIGLVACLQLAAIDTAIAEDSGAIDQLTEAFGELHIEPFESFIEDFLQNMREGQHLTQDDRERANRRFSSYFNELSAKHGVQSNYRFGEPDRTEFYVNAVKMAIIDPNKHGGWPVRSGISRMVYRNLQQQIKEEFDAYRLLSAALPALQETGNSGYAIKAFETLLEKDPFLAKHLVGLSAANLFNADWLIDHYLDSGRKDMARKVGEMAAGIDHWAGPKVYGELLEQLGNLDEAGAVFRRGFETYNSIGPLVDFYSRNAEYLSADGISNRQRLEDLGEKVFPEGMQKVMPPGFNDRPVNGVLIRTGSSLSRSYGLHAGSVVVAVDGIKVENLLQYNYMRYIDLQNKRIHLIFWHDGKYGEAAVWADERRLGVNLQDYRN